VARSGVCPIDNFCPIGNIRPIGNICPIGNVFPIDDIYSIGSAAPRHDGAPAILHPVHNINPLVFLIRVS
jgi:hypothetical protein